MISTRSIRRFNLRAKYRFLSRSLPLRHSVWPIAPFKRDLSDSTNLDGLTNTSTLIAQFQAEEKKKVNDSPSNIKQEPQLVYESPLGNVVSKLRTVSLMTAIVGMTGVPCMIALKGAIPEGGILAAAMLFVTGSVGSTAAIHLVFSPYVYRIEQIAIRQCSAKSTCIPNVDSVIGDINIDSSSTSRKDTLLKAWTRSLFLFNTSVVFDPSVDVKPYKGMRPMCNFLAKGRPLYVHPEFVYDTKLRLAMNLDAVPVDSSKSPSQSNPDDDLF